MSGWLPSIPTFNRDVLYQPKTWWPRLLRFVCRYLWGEITSHKVPLDISRCLVHVHSAIRPVIHQLSEARPHTISHSIPFPLQLPIHAVSGMPTLSTSAYNGLLNSDITQNSVHRAPIGDSFPITRHTMPVLESFSRKTYTLTRQNLSTKAQLLTWNSPALPQTHIMPAKRYQGGFKVKPKPLKLGDSSFSRHFRSRVERLLPIPIEREPIPAHRFPTEQRAIFRQKLAEQCDEPGSILIRYVYDRVAQGVYQQLLPQGNGTLRCQYKQNQTIKQLQQQRTELGMVVVGQHMVTRQTITAFIPLSAFTEAP